MKKDEALQSPQTHAEAPRSATVNVKTKNGFYWLFTMREDTAKDLITDMEKLEQIMLLKGWTPVEPRGGGFPPKPKLPEKPCPIPGHENLRERPGKDGKPPYWSHSKGVYPNLVWCNGQGFPGEMTQESGSDNIVERDVRDDF